MKYKFRRPLPAPYQIVAIKRVLKRKRFGVFFQQRVGKSRVAVDIAGFLNLTRGIDRVLIACPKSAKAIWEEQIKQYVGVPVAVSLDPDVDWSGIDMLKVWVLNYDIVRTRFERIKTWKPQVVVADEVHLLKHHTRRRSRVMQKLADQAEYVIGLTGTPGKIEEWFGIWRFIDPSIFGLYYNRFEREHLVVSRARGYPELLDYRDEVKTTIMIQDASIRVLRSDTEIKEPPTEDVVVPVTLEPTAKELYKKLAKESYLKIGEEKVTAAIILTKLMRLHQLAGGFLSLDSGEVQRVSKAKETACRELVEDLLEAGEQVIIVCRFLSEIDALSSLGTTLTGADDEKERNRKRLAFDEGNIKVLIVQEQVGSMSLDLAAARIMVFYSVDHGLQMFQQVRDRVMGRRQTRPVTYYYIQAKGTVDVEIMRSLRQGEDVVKRVNDVRRWIKDADV